MTGLRLAFPENAQDPDAAQKLWDVCLEDARARGHTFMELATLLKHEQDFKELICLSADLHQRLFKLLKGSARRPTQDTLFSKLGRSLAVWPGMSWAGRIHIHFGETGEVRYVDYCSGQSFPDEIARVRKDLLNM